MIIFGTSGKMESNRLIFAVVIAISFILSCCDLVSSSLTEEMETVDSDPFNPLDQQQCTWIYRDNPHDCRSYFECQNGRSVLRRCPRKLYWNAEGHYCEHMHKSNCKARVSKRIGTLSSSSKHILEVYEDRKEHPLKGMWKEPCTPGYQAYPTDCSKYIVCGSSNDATVMNCSPGLLWDTNHNICNWPSAVNCKPSAGAAPQAVIMSSTTTEAPLPTQLVTTNAPIPTSSSTLPPWTTTTLPPWTTPTTSRPTTTKPTTYRPPTPSSPTQYPILVPVAESQATVSKYKIICYFTNWAVYRKNGGSYTPQDVDPTKCTHIIYAFACINPYTYKLEMCDSWIDGKEGKDFYGQINAFKEQGVTTMIAIGGWNDSGYSKWTLLLKDVFKMETFIKSVCEFLKKYNFDGVDLDYEYPTCPQANCNFDSKFEKQAFVALVKGLRQMCGPQTVLSAAVSCNENIIKEAYDVPTLSKYLDFMNLMAYDFHGSWEPFTGINAPHKVMAPDAEHLNANHAVETFCSLGATPDKLCLGMPMYGQTFLIEDPLKDNGIGAKSRGPGPAGPCTQQKGMLAYYEICSKTWTNSVQDHQQRVGPYHYNITDGLWVSHDDEKMIETKCNYIKERQLGGAMIWALDMDDFSNKCGKGRYPLLTTINKTLRGNKKPVKVPASAKRRLVKGSIPSNTKTISNTDSSNGRRISRRQRTSRRQS